LSPPEQAMASDYGTPQTKYGRTADALDGRHRLPSRASTTPTKGDEMDLYVIRRRNAWATAEDLEAAAVRSTAEGDKEGSGVRWIRSYVVLEDDGQLGTVCIYQAESPEAIRAHATAAGMPADEITRVADTVIVRDDPVPLAA
jgi:hypothetical protein